MSSLEQRYRIVHTDSNSVDTDITEAVELSEEEGIESTMDTFSFRILISNTGALTIPTFAVNDKIKIYFGNGSNTPTTLVMDGLISEITYDLSVDGIFAVVRGVNRLERLLNTQVPASYAVDYSYTGTQDSVARTGITAAIVNLLDRANDNALEGETAIGYDTTTIPNTRSDGTAWPNMPNPYFKETTSVFEHIETLSNNEWTEDGNYIMFLDTNNKFNWQPLNSTTYNTPVSELKIDGNNVINAKVMHGIFDVVNAVIINAGDDFNGNSILAFYADYTSIGLYGAKWRYIIKKDIAEREKERDDSQSNSSLRTNVKALARAEGRRIVTILGNPRYKVDATIIGDTTYTKGKTYTIVSDTMGWNTATTKRNLRLRQIRHNFNQNGWFTTLHFEEDEKTLESV